jgi:RNA polymerase sigma factor (sigma-70 family)
VRTVAIPAPVALAPLRSKRLLILASDDTLVEQIRRGNEAAFSVVFERYAAGLLRFCRHMVGSPEEAEDAVQHTFAAAFRDLARPGEREVALKPWLYAVARNRCLSMLRSRRKQAVLDFDLPTEGLAEQVERRADLRDLLRDLRELPEDQRAALLLSEAGDLSHAEVAGVLGCEVANVKALVFRARSGLLQRWEARETACADIREQLANLQGSSLRRNGLRHHLRSCAGCRAYREQLKHQRQMLAAALPVVLSLDLRSRVLAAAGLGGGSAGGGLAAGVGTGLSASLGAGTLVKVATVGVLVGGAVASGKALVADIERLLAPPPNASARSSASVRPTPPGVRLIGGRATEHGAPQTELRVAEGRAPEQRSGASPPSAGQPDGGRGLGQESNANAAPSASDAPGRGEGAGSEDNGSAGGPATKGGGRIVEPPASTPGQGGPPPDKSGKGGSPSELPGRGGSPSVPPGRGGQASGPSGTGGPASGPSGRGGLPSEPPGTGGPASEPPGRGGPASEPSGRGGPASGPPGTGGPASGPSGRGGPSSEPPGTGGPASGPSGRGGPSSEPPGRGGPASEPPGRGGPASEPPGRGASPSEPPDTGGPTSGPSGKSGPTPRNNGNGGPPAKSPDTGGPPSGTPGEGGPPPSNQANSGPPQGNPGKGGAPPSTPVERAPPERPSPKQGMPEPKPSNEQPVKTTAPEPAPVAAPKPASGPRPPLAPGPP